MQELVEEFINLECQAPELTVNTYMATCADERPRALNGKFIDCGQPLDEVLEEVEKPEGGRTGKANLYHLKLDGLRV